MSISMSGKIKIKTDRPIAYDSPDHIQPHGTADNNTTSEGFNRKLFRLIPPEELHLLDLGCSGGGLVKSVLDAGGFAVGIEGSDYSLKRKRAEWATIPDYLFTADATVPFRLFEESADGSEVRLKFNVVSAWEFFEHIAPDQVDGVVENVLHHLAPGGIVLASIATYPDVVGGVTLHQTVERKPWWIKKFANLGLENQPSVERFFNFDMLNGQPIGPSFTIALSRVNESPIHSDRLARKASDLPYESMRMLDWVSRRGTWMYLAWLVKRKIEHRLGGRKFT
jgi:SAM-dependent methyltransferase